MKADSIAYVASLRALGMSVASTTPSALRLSEVTESACIQHAGCPRHCHLILRSTSFRLYEVTKMACILHAKELNYSVSSSASGSSSFT